MRRSRLRGKSGRRTACDRILLHTAVRSLDLRLPKQKTWEGRNESQGSAKVGACGKQNRPRRGGARNVPASVSLHPAPDFFNRCINVNGGLYQVILLSHHFLQYFAMVWLDVWSIIWYYLSVSNAYWMHLPQGQPLYRRNGFVLFVRSFISVRLLTVVTHRNCIFSIAFLLLHACCTRSLLFFHPTTSILLFLLDLALCTMRSAHNFHCIPMVWRYIRSFGPCSQCKTQRRLK